MKEITQAQEEIMRVLWQIKEGVVNDILDQLQEPRPAYNTVSTVVRVLEKKGYVGHKTYGKTHVYYPKTDKKEYARQRMKELLSGYFSNSVKSMVSFFAREEKIELQELEEIRKLIEEEIKKQKTGNE
jgi:BlaI family penicillinase repressor